MANTSKRPPAEWQRPTLYSIAIFAMCIGALVWAAATHVVGADKALLGGIGVVILWLTQGARRVMPADTTTTEIIPPPPRVPDVDDDGGDK